MDKLACIGYNGYSKTKEVNIMEVIFSDGVYRVLDSFGCEVYATDNEDMLNDYLVACADVEFDLF